MTEPPKAKEPAAKSDARAAALITKHLPHQEPKPKTLEEVKLDKDFLAKFKETMKVVVLNRPANISESLDPKVFAMLRMLLRLGSDYFKKTDSLEACLLECLNCLFGTPFISLGQAACLSIDEQDSVLEESMKTLLGAEPEVIEAFRRRKFVQVLEKHLFASRQNPAHPSLAVFKDLTDGSLQSHLLHAKLKNNRDKPATFAGLLNAFHKGNLGSL